MSSKVSVVPILRDHYSTLRDARTDKPHWPDYAVQVIAPLAAGITSSLFGVEVRELASLIAGLAVLSGFTFGLLIYVFQLRIQAASDPRLGVTHTVVDLIDELFANVSYALVVGFVAVLVAMTGASLQLPSAVTPWLSGLLIAFTLHFTLTMSMCVKRTHAAYQRMRR